MFLCDWGRLQMKAASPLGDQEAGLMGRLAGEALTMLISTAPVVGRRHDDDRYR